MLFAFDGVRRAVMLVGADMSSDWTGRYVVNIGIADGRFTEHQQALESGARQASEGTTSPTKYTAGRMEGLEARVLTKPGAAARV